MRLALIGIPTPGRLTGITAEIEPPRDRTTRGAKAAEDCKAAWTAAFDNAKAEGQPAAKALRHASVAYKLAMPRMDTMQNIRAAITCIAQGIQLEVFDGRDGSQLLYAAQVAMSVIKQKGRAK